MFSATVHMLFMCMCYKYGYVLTWATDKGGAIFLWLTEILPVWYLSGSLFTQVRGRGKLSCCENKSIIHLYQQVLGDVCMSKSALGGEWEGRTGQ